jgi:hypothetical protein
MAVGMSLKVIDFIGIRGFRLIAHKSGCRPKRKTGRRKL